MLTTKNLARAAVLALAAALYAACVINPATGQRQLVLVSEAQELQLGRENDQALTADLGLYGSAELQAYVQELGASIAARSERPTLDWQFRVVDDPAVNAFALPGGFIYITRGILAHFNNEAELASVIGHEIGHVTGRHSVNQMSKAQLAQLGLLGGMILAPERAEQFGGLAQTAMGVMFLKFSRDHERQADDLGLRYLIAGGYDPRPMPDVFETLRRVGESGGGERLPGWMSTHPLPENRRERIGAQIAESGQNFSGRPVRRDEYFARIDGIMFGEDPQQGYFKDRLFVHPQMEFQLQFPDGWQHVNQRQAVISVSPDKDAMVQMSLSSATSASAAHEAFFKQEGLTRTGPALRMSGGLPSIGGGFSVATEQGTLRGLVAHLEHRGRVFQLVGYTSEVKWPALGRLLESAVASFDTLRDRRAIEASARKVEIVRLRESMSLADFSRRYKSTIPQETLALLNGVGPDSRLAAGKSYKVVTGGYTP